MHIHKRLAAMGLGVLLGANGVGAQQPAFPTQPPQFPVQPPRVPTQPTTPAQPAFPVAPSFPPSTSLPLAPTGIPGSLAPIQPPQTLPPTLLAPQAPAPQAPGANAPGSPVAEVPLPQPEQKSSLNAMDVSVKRVSGGWQVWAGQRIVRDVGDNENNARDLVRVFRDLRPTEWVTIGGARPVVEYGLTNGRPPVAGGGGTDQKADPSAGGRPGTTSQLPVAPAGFSGPAATGAGAKLIQAIDLRSARVEPLRGVWCVRDDSNILFNFGTDKAGAEQTIAVIRKYGFNRVGVVGAPTQPVMSYLFVSLDADPPKVNGGQLLLNAQVDALTRTGIPVPGVGFTGEMLKIDAKKVEARKEGTEWVVAAGPEVLGRFGPTEWAAREAARTVQDAKFTEFCKLGGTSGLTFFLRDGKPPTRAPFSAQGRNFDPGALKVQQINDKWVITENNKHLFDVSNPQEGEVVIRVLKSYGFDQMAHLTAGGPKGGVTFLVKNR